jgi:hypothetical protein
MDQRVALLVGDRARQTLPPSFFTTVDAECREIALARRARMGTCRAARHLTVGWLRGPRGRSSDATS